MKKLAIEVLTAPLFLVLLGVTMLGQAAHRAGRYANEVVEEWLDA